MQRIHTERVKNAKNSPPKDEKNKEFIRKGEKLQRIQSGRAKNAKKFTPKGWKMHRIHP